MKPDNKANSKSFIPEHREQNAPNPEYLLFWIIENPKRCASHRSINN